MPTRPKKPRRPKCLLCNGTGEVDAVSFANPYNTMKRCCHNCHGKKRTPVMVDVYDILEALYDLDTGASMAMIEFIEKHFTLPEVKKGS